MSKDTPIMMFRLMTGEVVVSRVVDGSVDDDSGYMDLDTPHVFATVTDKNGANPQQTLLPWLSDRVSINTLAICATWEAPERAIRDYIQAVSGIVMASANDGKAVFGRN